MSDSEPASAAGDSAAIIQAAWQVAEQQQPQAALKLLEDLVNHDPSNVDAWMAAAGVFGRYGDLPQAADAYGRVLEIDEGHRAARLALAAALIEQRALVEAEPHVNHVLAEAPESAESWALLATLRQRQARVKESADAMRRAFIIAPNPTFLSHLLHSMQYVESVSPGNLLAAHREWDRGYAAPYASDAAAMRSTAQPGRPLRLGFVSSDFGSHPTRFLVLPALEHLNKSRAFVACYYDRFPSDDRTLRFKAAADLWRVSAAWSDMRLAAQIREDQIDVLFDLMGHTGSRLLVFARKPAPVQITWAGYVGTTGLTAMDYLLADRFHVRPDEEGYYSEKVLRMPHDYICYCGPDDGPPVGSLPAQRSGRVRFGCFNNAGKLSPNILAAWAEILNRVPQSQLLLKTHGLTQPDLRDQLHVHFAQHHIPPQRVVLEGGSLHADLLAAYSRVDIGLYTQPYSGCLTTCEALWMGVPVITFPGQTFAGRHSVSHLTNAGYPQFIASDLRGYIDLAVTWASRLDELAALRAGMREQVRRSPLCDAERFANDFLETLGQVVMHPS